MAFIQRIILTGQTRVVFRNEGGEEGREGGGERKQRREKEDHRGGQWL